MIQCLSIQRLNMLHFYSSSIEHIAFAIIA